MDKQELIKKIASKKIYSHLPLKDIKLAFEKSNKTEYTDEEKIKKTRELLGRVCSAFSGQRLMTRRKLSAEEVLKRHRSTRERLPYYPEVYRRIFGGIQFKSVVDLGAGVNGFTYKMMVDTLSPHHPPNHSSPDLAINKKNLSKSKLSPTLKRINAKQLPIIEHSSKFFPIQLNYVGIEGVGQLVDLTNNYFKEKKIISRAKVHHFSLFELTKVIDIIKQQLSPKVILLFKVIDGLEILQRNYSKELINGIGEVLGVNDRIVVSFATKSFEKHRSFYAQRNWLIKFIGEKFKILDDFELGGERYIVFKKG